MGSMSRLTDVAEPMPRRARCHASRKRRERRRVAERFRVGSWPERTIACASWPIHHTRYAIDNFVKATRAPVLLVCRAMSERRAHPIAFLFLIFPFGAMGGYLTVALAYRLSKAGLGVGAIAGLVAISSIPHTWKFAWAPIADTTLHRRTWYLIGSVASAAGMWLMGALPATPANVPLLSAIVLIANVAVTFLGMSVESLMAYGTSDEQKGRAGGWFQAGNLGGQGVGGGAGLWLAQALPAPWMAGAGLAVACPLCALPLLFIPEPDASHRHPRFTESLRNVARDLWNVAR